LNGEQNPVIHLRMLEALFFFRHPGPRGASARDQVSSHPFPAKSGNESAKRLQIIVAKLISIDQIVYYIYYIYMCVCPTQAIFTTTQEIVMSYHVHIFIVIITIIMIMFLMT
jgi:hypothetical protein